MSTFVITGGHHNSALVVAKELKSRGHKVVWIGHRYSSRGDTVDSAEYIEVTAAKIPFHDLTAGKLVLNLKEFIHFPLGLAKSFELLKAIQPSAIISFGGYLGGTVALTAKVLNIPIYLHEQTVTAGRANKLIGKLSKKIYLTWAESAKYFDKSKTQVVGLPLRDNIPSGKAKQLFTRRKPTILVMGGKQGAHTLNHFVFTHLSELLKDFNIIHQTGTSSVTGDYEKSCAYRAELGSLSDSYLPLGYISEFEIGHYLYSADIYLGRSGAHICYELGVTAIPSILVPLMSTHDHEQHKNASILESSGIGLILPQSELSFPHFVDKIKELKKLSGRPMKLPKDASIVMVDSILSTLK
jgi:UDP-N-acetylglucosamine--N-acetylmuramyl-(pentapeptide) pyrophosphoryl-undecaprenol N-acetylglucosamine transferase